VRVIHPALLAAALLLVLMALLARPSPASSPGGWLRPVPGEVVQPFDYRAAHAFAPGAHRGADLAARPGATVRAACSGQVVHAGVVARLGKVVTVRCGVHRVTYLPLGVLYVRNGGIVLRGVPLGTLAPGHGGLHLGARHARDRFAYEDPMARMGSHVPAPPAVLRRPQPVRPLRLRPPTSMPVRTPASPAAPARPPAAAPLAAPAVVARRPDTTVPAVAPWPVWAGAALVLAGSVGSYTVALRRRRREAARAPTTAAAVS
jgi:murein DD-endopeptidase MepM/ murein hydrolase activator NlpD